MEVIFNNRFSKVSKRFAQTYANLPKVPMGLYFCNLFHVIAMHLFLKRRREGYILNSTFQYFNRIFPPRWRVDQHITVLLWIGRFH